MNKLRWVSALMCLCVLLWPATALAALPTQDAVYRLVDVSAKPLTSRAGQIFVGDEYISSDNQLYRVTFVDDAARLATAECLGPEPDLLPPRTQPNMAVFASAEAKDEHADAGTDKGLICMYSTHSDESYVPTDGASSKEQSAGIYDVGDALQTNLQKLGWNVDYSKKTFHPHDAGAYRRSRQVAEDFIKQNPTALLDLHRDGIPDPEEYETEVDGEQMTKIRLFVGRSNPNSSANRSLAKKIKAEADDKYPNLIKDIFVGKGDYNQDLYPRALLLEMGTHTSDKDKVEKSTQLIAQVLDNVLQGAASAEGTRGAAENRSAAHGILWLVCLCALGALLYGLVSTGTLRNWREKLARGTSELTGGALGKSHDDDAEK